MPDTAERSAPSPLYALLAMLESRHPGVDSAVVRTTEWLRVNEDEPDRYVRVSCCKAGPWRVVWDADAATFGWDPNSSTCPKAGLPLGPLDDVDRVADQIHDVLCAVSEQIP
ncbi:hypothetical protein J4573_30320 [Actinomadura barringtoniae]|uniref:Uncharacterized protein n=1 Tax=Actinomadura barringtoniae TaxID=1427535 RepID=A0A939TCM7_9ACTN|nr:hypothetical protein [Actinomadura barringtoniae]MBO2451420.1 hypothetical protein [Actinomadura barringtoniae]